MTKKPTLTREMLDFAIEEAIAIVTRNMNKWKKKLPIYSDTGVYNVVSIETIKDMGTALGWSVGCGPGIYWLCYKYTGDEKFKEMALQIVDEFVVIKRPPSQCQGILYMPVCIPAYRYCQNENAKKMLLDGANLLCEMFEHEGNYFRAWNEIKNFSIDSIINITIMHWASQITGDPLYYDLALKHIETQMDIEIRPDGSTFNLIDTDDGGKIVGCSSNHILDENGCWSRGQAWAMYGFAMHYKFTSNPEYLSCFKKIASYFFDNLDDNMMPCYDLKLKNRGEPIDTSAASIAVCACLEMASILPDDKHIAAFRAKADEVMFSLIKNYSVAYDNYIDALILGGAYCVKSGWKDEALVYGDYFYLETLVRYLSDDYESCWQ